ncbi:MAG TPA: CheB methylesterase domain-containing protein [Methylovirgula sp.]|jgi:two-component system chemotaxis response regulator CheB
MSKQLTAERRQPSPAFRLASPAPNFGIGRLPVPGPRIIVIGASTGGPQALSIVLKGLIAAIEEVPVFIVLHIPPEFTDVISSHIERVTGLPAHAAQQGEEIAKGHIYISPGNRHLGVARVKDSGIIALNDEPPENYCKPSVDVLFRSAAKAYGEQVIGIVLTGMGSDGLAGSREIVSAGGMVIAQDAASSTVWGMPRSVVDEGLAHAVLSVEAIGPTVCGLMLPFTSVGRKR